ncbi:DUF2993 domain-containing protein [Amycolatopsis decaplanina]|uniref:DUF2993 domain-containing protein n=1 Tax=Amycolatopsis decaplanina DSM 44594 TaxID=1284240 RepID=M2YQ07_9PSEU|nr:DUF2993 domain-containing protein [Amycolatopsis decaplanina]EME56922.1 hypothetical protein H074_23674 [Amycolatopsis decaplanina DSM 44594]
MVSRPVARDDRPSSGRSAKRGKRRGRGWLIALAVLVVLLVGADFGAAAFAEHTISQKTREQLKLANDPAVTVHGFPFLTQALSGDYGHITISAQGVAVPPKLRDVDFNADMSDVTAPLSDLTSGNTKSIVIGTLKGEVTIKAADIARQAPLDKIENLRIEPVTEDYVRNGDSGQGETKPTATNENGEPVDTASAGIRVSGNVQIAGQKVEIFCFAMIELDGQKIRLEPKRLQFGNDKETTVVPQAVQDALLPNFNATIDTGAMPFSVTPTSVRVNSGTVTIKGEGKNVAFSEAKPQG